MNMIGHQAVADQQHLMQRKVLSQQSQIHPAVSIALQKKTAAIAPLGHMVRYSNGYHSGQTCHNSNSSKKILSEVIFRIGYCPLIRLSTEHRVNFPSVPKFPGAGGPTLFTAIEEQLGLKLQTQKAPVDCVVIDHIEQPSPN